MEELRPHSTAEKVNCKTGNGRVHNHCTDNLPWLFAPILAAFPTSFPTVIRLNLLQKPCETPHFLARQLREAAVCGKGWALLLAISSGGCGQEGQVFMCGGASQRDPRPSPCSRPPACLSLPPASSSAQKYPVDLVGRFRINKTPQHGNAASEGKVGRSALCVLKSKGLSQTSFVLLEKFSDLLAEDLQFKRLSPYFFSGTQGFRRRYLSELCLGV